VGKKGVKIEWLRGRERPLEIGARRAICCCRCVTGRGKSEERSGSALEPKIAVGEMITKKETLCGVLDLHSTQPLYRAGKIGNNSGKATGK